MGRRLIIQVVNVTLASDWQEAWPFTARQNIYNGLRQRRYMDASSSARLREWLAKGLVGVPCRTGSADSRYLFAWSVGQRSGQFVPTNASSAEPLVHSWLPLPLRTRAGYSYRDGVGKVANCDGARSETCTRTSRAAGRSFVAQPGGDADVRSNICTHARMAASGTGWAHGY